MVSISDGSLDKGGWRKTKSFFLFACLPLCLVGKFIYLAAAAAAAATAVITVMISSLISEPKFFWVSNVDQRPMTLQESSKSSNGDY